ncbi:hypothetical protein FRC12_023424 [Ceratobasidium sp. 428]|nr:hypothetical protein FRC12_023424 [Ceratobasidium sp. 428]
MIIKTFVLRCTAKRSLSFPALVRQNSTNPRVAVDEFGVPVRATWSVEKLLSTYPAPALPPDTLARLHRLSALQPPEPNSPEAESLRLELQELLRLVEAVKLVDTSALGGTEHADIPDSRIWAEGRGIDLDAPDANHLDEAHGRALLRHASKHVDGQYVVETAPRARGSKATRAE